MCKFHELNWSLTQYLRADKQLCSMQAVMQPVPCISLSQRALVPSATLLSDWIRLQRMAQAISYKTVVL